MRFVVVRHAQRSDEAPDAPVAPVFGLADGAHHPDDPPLTRVGAAQAEVAAGHISSVVLESHDFDALYCSPMLRCIQTARPLAKELGLPIVVEAGVGVVALCFKRRLSAGVRPALLAFRDMPRVCASVPDVSVSYDRSCPFPRVEDDYRVSLERIARRREAEASASTTERQKAVLVVTHREGIRYLDKLCGEGKMTAPYCACHEYDFDVVTGKWTLVHDSKIATPQLRKEHHSDKQFAYPGLLVADTSGSKEYVAFGGSEPCFQSTLR